jgi:hypothetical protein
VLVQDRDTRWRRLGIKAPKCHFFNSFFVNKLYRQVQRVQWVLALSGAWNWQWHSGRRKPE